MHTINDPRISAGLKALIAELVIGDYATMIAKGRFIGDEDALREFLALYPGHLTMPPDEAFATVLMFVYAPDQTFQIDMSLWLNGQPSEIKAATEGYEDEDGDLMFKLIGVFS
jgi:hypothetical protein